MLLNAVLLECLLQHLVVLNKFVLMLSSPFDFGDSEATWVNGVDDLTINGASSGLLYFGHGEL